MWLNNYVGKHTLGTVEYIDEEANDGGKRVWKSTAQSKFSIRCTRYPNNNDSVNGTDVGYGQASKKVDAREMAARQALARLKEEAAMTS
jgi:hypothetical protein